jgi:hypothetical protein
MDDVPYTAKCYPLTGFGRARRGNTKRPRSSPFKLIESISLEQCRICQKLIALPKQKKNKNSGRIDTSEKNQNTHVYIFPPFQV